MAPNEQRALLTIALLAAFADGVKDDRERDSIKRMAESMVGPEGAPELSSLYQDVLLKRADVAQCVGALTDPAQRQLAYELAVCVCDADGQQNPSEQRFLSDLKQRLGLADAQTAAIEHDANTLATAPLAVGTAAISPTIAARGSAGATAPTVSESELDKYILNHAIVNGALELLPQSLASMAIIALQIKLVYRIGKAYGHELDKGHIKEFIATAGVGLTSQYVEQIGRKLLGGLLGGIAGGIGRGIGRAATGMAFSFATTYALGQLAKRYYSGGRQMNQQLLRQTYESLLVEAKQLQNQHMGDIQQKARTLDLREVMSFTQGP